MDINNSPPILLVEDDANDVFFAERAFKAAGLFNPLRIVHDGREAIRYLSGEGIYVDRTKYPIPSMMLLDVNMPILNGFDVLDWLQRHPVAKMITVVLTSSFNPADMRRAISLGAADYQVKPMDSAQLVPLLRGLHARWLSSDPAKGTVGPLFPAGPDVPSRL